MTTHPLPSPACASSNWRASLPVPGSASLLADLGADVVKVEAPEGDDTRKWGPPFVEGLNGEHLSAAYFHAANRGKRSITADFRTAEGQALVRKLAAHADIVVENFKVGGLEKYGLDAASLRANLSTPDLLLGDRLRPDRPLCAPRRLRLPRAGHGRPDVGHRRARRARR
jgi:hypothetical protein